MDTFAVHYLIWCLLAQPVHELSLCLLNACLLCLHLLLTLCIWNSSLTAASIPEYSVSLSSARVGATSNAWHSFKLLAVHFADQAQAVVKLPFALPSSLLWMSVLEGASHPEGASNPIYELPSVMLCSFEIQAAGLATFTNALSRGSVEHDLLSALLQWIASGTQAYELIRRI